MNERQNLPLLCPECLDRCRELIPGHARCRMCGWEGLGMETAEHTHGE